MFKKIGITLLAYTGIRFFVDSTIASGALTFGLAFLAIGVVVNPRLS